MATPITYADLNPETTDRELDLRLKKLLSVRACSQAILGGAGDGTIDPLDTDSELDILRKELRAVRELQAALGG